MILSGAFLRVVDGFWTLADNPRAGLDFRSESAWIAARTLTRCYYAGLMMIAFAHLSNWNDYTGLRGIRPLWPVAWASGSGGGAAMTVLLLFVGGSLLAAVFPESLAARAAAFVGCLEFFAFDSSFGAVRHVNHLLILTTFLFVLLPRSDRRGGDVEARRGDLRAFWGVQCGALLTYSMAGFLKLATGIWHLVTGRSGVLAPGALALHVANSGIRFGIDPPFAGEAIAVGALGLPIYLLVIYFELFAVVAAFRPRLHRLWGAALLILHLTIGLTMNLFFVSPIFLLAILLLASPFAPASAGWSATLRELPLFGRLVARGPLPAGSP